MTISTDQFAAEARSFLDAHAEARVEESFEWGKGSDKVGILEEKSPDEEAAEVSAAKAWKATEFDAGFGWITGPEPSTAGGALPPPYERTLPRARGRVRDPLPDGVRHRARHGRADDPRPRDRRRCASAYLRPLYRGDIVACQLFSEPVAGSDLAGIQTRAMRDGDEWIVTGQKVWTSGAQHSDIGEIITRTSPDKPKHKGLTMFVVDMKAPGVEVRPLRQMTGGASFNEVFFDEVRVHDSHRLGDVDEGWTVALTTLMNERAAIGGGGRGFRHDGLHALRRDGAALGVADDPSSVSGSPTSYVHLQVATMTNLRGDGEDPRRPAPGPGDVDRQARAHAEHAAHRGDARPRCSALASSPTAASGARTPGRSSCSASPACASPAAPTR